MTANRAYQMHDVLAHPIQTQLGVNPNSNATN
jgi:hypothetical protein